MFERPIFFRLHVLNGLFPNPLLSLSCYVALRLRFAPFPDLAKRLAAVPVPSRNSALACHGLATLWQKQFRTAISTFPAIFLRCPLPHFLHQAQIWLKHSRLSGFGIILPTLSKFDEILATILL